MRRPNEWNENDMAKWKKSHFSLKLVLAVTVHNSTFVDAVLDTYIVEWTYAQLDAVLLGSIFASSIDYAMTYASIHRNEFILL